MVKCRVMYEIQYVSNKWINVIVSKNITNLIFRKLFITCYACT